MRVNDYQGSLIFSKLKLIIPSIVSFVLGISCLCCEDVPQPTTDPHNAKIALLIALANHGDAQAQIELFSYYSDENGAEKNMQLAIQWLKRAALQGNTWAQTNLGIIYLRGEEVIQDQEIGFIWLLLAAEKGDVGAQSRVAYCYATGKGVVKNLIQAAKWNYILLEKYERAKESGKSNGEISQEDQPQALALKVSEHDGEKSEQFTKGTGYALIVQSRTMPNAIKNLQMIEKELSVKDILAAKKMAGDWFKR